MGNQANMKDLRKQLRNVVQDLLPSLVTTEVVSDIERRLTDEMGRRLNAIDERQKDIQSMLIRNTTLPQAKEPVAETPVAKD